MQTTLTNRIMDFTRAGIPFTLSVFLILLAIMPYGLPKSSLAAFLLGLMVDILSGGPPGLNALVLIMVNWAASGQRRALAGKSFAVGWLGYLLIAAGAAVINWFVASLFHATIIESVPLLVSHAVGAAVYPLVAVLLARAHTLTLPT